MRYQDLLYIIDFEFRTVCSYGEEKEDIYSLRLWLKEIFKTKLKDFEAYKKTVSKVLKIKQMLPIYIDNKVLLWQLKASDKTRFLINYYKIKDINYSGDYMEIYFKNNYILQIKKTRQSYYRDLKKIKKFISYLESNNIN